jgi:hypothetical protein
LRRGIIGKLEKERKSVELSGYDFFFSGVLCYMRVMADEARSSIANFFFFTRKN